MAEAGPPALRRVGTADGTVFGLSHTPRYTEQHVIEPLTFGSQTHTQNAGERVPPRSGAQGEGGPQLASSCTASTRAGPAGAQRPTGEPGSRGQRPRGPSGPVARPGPGQAPGTAVAGTPNRRTAPGLVTVTDRTRARRMASLSGKQAQN